MRIVNVICILLLLAGCRTTAPPQIVEVKTEKTTRIVDTLVKVVPDSSLLQALLECDSLGRVQMRQISDMQLKGIGLDVKVKDNNLSVKAKGSDKARVRTITDSVYIEKPVKVPYPVEVNNISSWQWFQIWCGRIACLMVLLYLGYRMLTGKFQFFYNALKRAIKLD